MDKKFPDIYIGWAWVFTLIDKQNYRLPTKSQAPPHTAVVQVLIPNFHMIFGRKPFLI